MDKKKELKPGETEWTKTADVWSLWRGRKDGPACFRRALLAEVWHVEWGTGLGFGDWRWVVNPVGPIDVIGGRAKTAKEARNAAEQALSLLES